MSRPVTIKINSAVLTANLGVIRSIAPRSKIWAVVKANAYGHGLSASYRGLSGADGFALLDVHEAVGLRESGWKGPILLLEGFFHRSELEEIDHHEIIPVLHSYWQVEALGAYNLRKILKVYVKVNTGMNRLGFGRSLLLKVWNRLGALRQIAKPTLMTHFAFSSPEGIAEQTRRVLQINSALDAACCLANSAAVLSHPESHAQWIRPGIILYGISPGGGRRNISDLGLKPAMTLRSKIIAVQRVRVGDHVGYDGCYQVREKQRIGIVACGYADGYPRGARTGTPVSVDGVRTQILGTVSMDTLVVDLQPCPQARIGSEVELWGESIGIDVVASSAGTSSYELMSRISPRVRIETEPAGS